MRFKNRNDNVHRDIMLRAINPSVRVISSQASPKKDSQLGAENKNQTMMSLSSRGRDRLCADQDSIDEGQVNRPAFFGAKSAPNKKLSDKH